ncbi:MAG: two-component system, OmpR family, sensor kinase [Solirubrobacteraceae bacterium]|jgi:signal transduction histidine kinase|nr:two-component system, OmpR family, sensor kinase [Solirubrobacteraceae bacterium]
MSRASSIRSAAQATFSAPRQIPIRWRLAGGSALLTLVILCGFAGAVGGLTTQRLHQDFGREVRDAADLAQARIKYDAVVSTGFGDRAIDGLRPPLSNWDDGVNVVRIVLRDGLQLDSTTQTKDFGPPKTTSSNQLVHSYKQDGYLVETRELPHDDDAVVFVPVYLQYARPLASVDATVGSLRLFLVIGVLSGAGLALLAGLMVARRAMAPIAALTATARKIERTRDPAEVIPTVEADDEVAELARTLDGMLHALDASRGETEDALRRQREFVADASHELRTPLTSVLANLELLAESLDGEQQEAAHSALRSSRRMRRLVADLLLLARHDAARQAPHTPTDVGQVLVEAAGELGVIADGHELSIDANRAYVDGARDELHRLTLNLVENAIRHTPPGTRVQASVERVEGHVRLTVEDDGPGIPADLKSRVFERFVRGVGDRGGSSGLGLSIVQAVAQSHGGTVTIVSPATNGVSRPRGTRFEVTLPASSSPQHAESAPASPPTPVESS